MYRNCYHNQKVALRNRYMLETPELQINKQALNYAKRRLINELKAIESHLTPLTMLEFLNRYTGSKRTRYENAVANLYEKRELKSTIDIFIKDEFYLDQTKPPRCIYSRDYGFNALYGRYTIPIEEVLMKHPFVAKGKNYQQRSLMFKNFYNKYTKYYENDYSKFESSQRPQLLNIEMQVIKAMYPGHNDQLDILNKLRITKNLRSRQGIKAKLYGCRGSGDMDTGLGNTILNLIAIYYTAYLSNAHHIAAIVDGDDAVIFSNRELIPRFSDLGFSCKFFERKDNTEIEFCSGRFLKINPCNYYFVQDPNKFLTGLTIYRPSKSYNSQSYYYTLGYMYRIIYGDLPFYSDISKLLLSNRKFKNTNFLKAVSEEFQFKRPSGIGPTEIDDAIFSAQFRSAFNLSPNTTLKFNAHLDEYVPRMNRNSRYIVKYQDVYETIPLKHL